MISSLFKKITAEDLIDVLKKILLMNQKLIQC